MAGQTWSHQPTTTVMASQTIGIPANAQTGQEEAAAITVLTPAMKKPNETTAVVIHPTV